MEKNNNVMMNYILTHGEMKFQFDLILSASEHNLYSYIQRNYPYRRTLPFLKGGGGGRSAYSSTHSPKKAPKRGSTSRIHQPKGVN